MAEAWNFYWRSSVRKNLPNSHGCQLQKPRLLPRFNVLNDYNAIQNSNGAPNIRRNPSPCIRIKSQKHLIIQKQQEQTCQLSIPVVGIAENSTDDGQ